MANEPAAGSSARQARYRSLAGDGHAAEFVELLRQGALPKRRNELLFARAIGPA
jgi:hypothetical protein